MKKLKKTILFGTIFLIIISYLIFLNRLGKLSIFFNQKELNSFQPDTGYAWIADIDDPKIAYGYDLPISFYEDETRYFLDESWTTADVREIGKGRFVVWNNGTICFSTSDNTDPNVNNRTYKFVYPKMLGNRLARYVYVITLLSLLIMLFVEIISNRKKMSSKLETFLFFCKENITYFSLLVGIAISFVVLGSKYLLRLPFWGDELFTLKNYVFSSNWFYPATYYNYPNNHVFYSLILSLYTRLFGITSFCEAVIQPWKIRSIHLLFAAVTIIFTSLTARKINRLAGIIAPLFLTSTIPFYTWTTQIRGYGLSIMCMSLLLYHYFDYHLSKKKYHLSIITIIAALLIYIMPSNAIFIIALMIVEFIETIRNCSALKPPFDWKFQFCKSLKDCFEYKLLRSFLFGGLLSLFLYFPILDQVLDVYLPDGAQRNFSLQSAIMSITKLLQNSVHAAKSFIANNEWFVIVGLIGAILYIVQKRKKDPIFSFSVRSMLLVILLPVFLFGITQYVPYPRNYLPLIPVYAFLAAVLISCISDVLTNNFLKKSFILIMIVVSQFSLIFQAKQLSEMKPALGLSDLSNLAKPYFVSDNFKINDTLKTLAAVNVQKHPILFSDPKEYYLEAICECFGEVCFYDATGPLSQEQISSKAPYWLIQTNWSDQSKGLQSAVFENQCVLSSKIEEAQYTVYVCNQ